MECGTFFPLCIMFNQSKINCVHVVDDRVRYLKKNTRENPILYKDNKIKAHDFDC
jgi:hypothetical protein